MSKFIILIALFIFPIEAVLAHPGRTASDGCHYCRTNCDKWGVPWNVRHCHHHVEPLIEIPVKENQKNNHEKPLRES